MNLASGNVKVELKFDLKKAEMEMRRKIFAALKKGILVVEAAAKWNGQQVAHDKGYNSNRIVGEAKANLNLTEMKANIHTESGYGGWLEIGTGLYGQHHSPIVPKKAKVLHWVDDQGEEIFALRSSGRPPTPYIRPAIETPGGKRAFMAQFEGVF
jgi:hypothetical protein